MKFVTPALLAVATVTALFVAAPSAHAQVAVYGTVTAQHLGGLSYTTLGTGTINQPTTRTNGTFDPVGGTGGIYYDFRQFGPVRLGVDARFSIAHTTHGADPNAIGSGGRLYTVMGGLRGSFPAHYRLLAPYAGVDFGLGRSDLGNGGTSGSSFSAGQVQISNGFAYQAVAGLDIHALSLLDVRLFELGIGGVSGVNSQSGQTGGQTGSQTGSHLLESLSIGVVLHLPR